MNYDENVRFEEGSDSGENDAASVQPIGGAETYHATVLNRPIENLRARTETLRKAVEDLNYFADYDRALILSSTGKFSIKQDSAGLYSVIATQDLWIRPALTPGGQSGGRAGGARLFVAGVEGIGTPGTNDLHIVASRTYTGQRGYADGMMEADAADTASVGANDISVEFVAETRTGGIGNIQITITGSPVRHIRVAWGTTGGGTTLNDLISKINADRTSQGSFGAADYIRASTTSPGTTTGLPTLGPTVLQGAYDAEAHRVTPAQFADFFSTSTNLLADKEGLAIGFTAGPVELGPQGTAKGGRRQSLYDQPIDRAGGFIDNTTPAVGNNLFNTGREPEKIPGAIPIGKVVDGAFVFLDGTVIPLPVAVGDTTATYALGESPSMLDRLASTTPGSTGASTIGFAATSAWNADAGDTLLATQVQAAIDEILTDLAKATNPSGARRVGMESVAATVSGGNTGLALVAGSVRQALSAILNTAASGTGGGGLNARVSEYGHQLHGARPIEKDLTETSPVALNGGGAGFLRVRVTDPTAANSFGNDHKTDPATIRIKKMAWSISGTDAFGSDDVTGVGTANDRVGLLTYTNAQLTSTRNRLRAALSQTRGHGTNPVPMILVKLTDTGIGKDGYYWLKEIYPATTEVSLLNLDGSTPSFVGMTNAGPPGIDFFESQVAGGAADGSYMTSFHVGAAPLWQIARPGPADEIMRTWDTQTFGNWSGNPSSIYYADRVVFRPGQTNGGGNSIARDSDAILNPLDADLLRGQENGVVIDATLSHHHGHNETGIATVSPPGTLFSDLVSNTTGAWAHNSGGAGISPFNGSVPTTGKRNKALIVNLNCNLKSAAAGFTGITIGIARDSLGTDAVYQTFNFQALAGAETHAFYASAVLTIADWTGTDAGRLWIRVTGTTNVDAATSDVTVFEAARMEEYWNAGDPNH